MKAINITKARNNLYQLVKLVGENHIPVRIVGKGNDAVLISADDWREIEETLYLTNIPGMTDSIVEGLKTSISECEDLNWGDIE